jgi:hypothetical protein
MADIQERLKKLGQGARIGGKGSPRRTVRRAPARSGADDKKLQQTLKKLNTQPIQAIEEVNMFKSDGNVIHFAAPKGAFDPTPLRAIVNTPVALTSLPQSTPPSPPTPLPSTVTARRRS